MREEEQKELGLTAGQDSEYGSSCHGSENEADPKRSSPEGPITVQVESLKTKQWGVKTHKCIVPTCATVKEGPRQGSQDTTILFCLPRSNPEIWHDDWQRALGGMKLPPKNHGYYKICQKHFRANQIIRCQNGEIRLRPNAVPTLRLPNKQQVKSKFHKLRYQRTFGANLKHF